MGCWNETCGVTQLPIEHNDPVTLFLLTKIPTKPEASGHCHSNDIWSPRSIQIYGNYNDYGSIEGFIESNWNIKFVINGLKQDAIPLKMGKNKFHDLPVIPEEFTFEKILRLIHENRLSVKTDIPSGTQKNAIGFMMVHQSVFDQLSTASIKSWRGKITLDRLIAEGREWTNELKQLAVLENIDSSWCEYKREMVVADLRHDFRTIFQQLASFDNVYVHHGIKDYLKELANLSFIGKDEKIISDMIVELAKFQLFNMNFEALRKTYIPQSGKGSQEQALNVHKNLFELSLNFINKRLEEDY